MMGFGADRSWAGDTRALVRSDPSLPTSSDRASEDPGHDRVRPCLGHG